MADNKIHVTNLKKNFGKLEVLKDISMDITEGEVVVLLGPSGSGKSTFLRCLNQLETATAGQILIDGYDVMDKHTDINKVRQNIGMVFQHFNLFNHLNVMDNMTLAPVHLKVMTKDEARKKAMELLTRVGLADKAEAFPSQLSGGQKQRVAIAGVLAMQPQCVVLDEPTAMLDPQGRREVLDTIERLNREKGITVILITHHMDEAVRAGRVIAMSEGKIIADGMPQQVFAQEKLLRSVGLDVPQTEQLLLALRARGVNIPTDALTPGQCARLLRQYIPAV